MIPNEGIPNRLLLAFVQSTLFTSLHPVDLQVLYSRGDVGGHEWRKDEERQCVLIAHRACDRERASIGCVMNQAAKQAGGRAG